MKQQQDFTKTIEWKYPAETTLLTWQIKTIGHQWQKVGYPVISVIAVFIVIFLAIFIHGFKDWGTPVLPLIGVFIFGLGLFGEVRRKTWFVYRVTAESIEIVYWRAYPKILFVLIRWIFAIMGVVVMIIGIALGEALVAMVGPIGMILSLGTWAVTKDYQEFMTNFTHKVLGWDSLTEAEYDKKRNVFRLHFKIRLTDEVKQNLLRQGIKEEDYGSIIMEWDGFIFSTPELTQQMLTLTEQYLPKALTLKYTQVTLPDMI